MKTELALIIVYLIIVLAALAGVIILVAAGLISRNGEGIKVIK